MKYKTSSIKKQAIKNETTNSYFYDNPSTIQDVNYSSNIQHLPYVSIPYTDSTLHHKHTRMNYIQHVNGWLKSYAVPASSCMYSQYSFMEQNGTMKINTILETMFEDLLNILIQKGYKILDVNQFKEDFIHYVYTLSDIDGIFTESDYSYFQEEYRD